jgi:sulfur carrier protein
VVTQPAKRQIRLNGQEAPLVAPNVEALLGCMDIDPAQPGIAVALNGSVVPRTAWAQTQLHSGDSVEVVRARQGG